MQVKVWGKLALVVIVALFLALVDLPPQQKSFLGSVPLIGENLKNQKINLGLDLQGGTHLDYKVITTGIPDQDVDKVIQGVKDVIERRVNRLGVAEPNIFTSQVGDERHIVVELAGIKDIEEAKKVVGKTIQLEFKEQKTGVEPGEAEAIKKKANEFLDRATKDPEKFTETFSDYEKKPSITLTEDTDWVWASDLPDGFQPAVKMASGQIYQFLIRQDAMSIEADSSSEQGYKMVNYEANYVLKLLAKEENADRTIETEEERKASHILIAFAGAERALETVTRTEKEAQTLATELLGQAQAEEADFAELAKQYSDDPSAASNSGDLGFFKRGAMTPAFEEATFEAAAPGLIPKVIRTSFGYHIIKLEEIKAATSEVKQETRVKFAKAYFNSKPDGWKETGLTGQHFRRADVGSDPTTMLPLVNVYFTKTAVAEKTVNWWQMVWYLVALAAGITLFSVLIGGFAQESKRSGRTKKNIILVVSAVLLAWSIYSIWQMTPKPVAPEAEAEKPVSEENEEADKVVSETDKAGVDLFAEITKRNLHKPIAIFLDGLPIVDTNRDGVIDEKDPPYSPVVQAEITNGQAVITGLQSYEEANELAQNLNTGAIPAPVKLVGQYTVGASLGVEALTTSLRAGLIGILLVILFMIAYYRLPGLVASIALIIYGILLLFALQLFHVVLTLAGVAGVILSIGMAVDANILIFERMKEEVKLGKSLLRSIDDGFARAWTSIRDSNVSSLITCAILYWFGSSIVKGFALTLGIGILISMFTAITISRLMLRSIISKVKSATWLGVKIKSE